VFGAVNLTTGDFFYEAGPPIIECNVVPGSRIWSNEQAAYNGLNAAGYQHETINHS